MKYKVLRVRFMKKKILPVMALTYQALCACMEQEVNVIYVATEIYTENIRSMLEKNGYHSTGEPLKRGILFAKDREISNCEILDPYGLL